MNPLLPLAAALALALPARAAPGIERAAVVVEAARSVGRVNPWVIGGHNMVGYQKGGYGGEWIGATDYGHGMWDPKARRPEPGMVALAREAGMRVARWPGGCGVHAFDWKKTVGPPEARPGQAFGLPEYLRVCEAISAMPLITLSDYHGDARDAADLVEYLNAPADGSHPWAARRAADGHPKPWRVVWFEYGNESEHGLHYGNDDIGKHRRFTPDEYARNYLAYRAAMRRVDPRVRLGAVVATGFPGLRDWAEPVCRRIGARMDFAIHHCYVPSYSGSDGVPDARSLFAAGWAAPDQIQDYYDLLNGLLRETTGRPDTPIAVTEFNEGFVQEKPVPYRHTLGNAIAVAEMMRVFLRPANHIVMANFWEFPNEYWGAVRGYPWMGQPLVRRPQFHPFALYHAHFGRDLLDAKVTCAGYATRGGWGVAPAAGSGSRLRIDATAIRPSAPWRLSEAPGVEQRLEGRAVEAIFGEAAGDVNYYHARVVMPARPSTTYRLSGWVRTEALSGGRGAGLQVGDARGWVVTRSAAVTPDIAGTHGWTRVEADYTTLPDTRSLEVLARRLEGGGPVTGRAWYRDVEVRRMTPRRYPAVPIVSAVASRSADGRRVNVVLVNKRMEAVVEATVTLRGFRPARARCWTLEGDAVDATNEERPDRVRVRERDLGAAGGVVRVALPPHSLTALEVSGLPAARADTRVAASPRQR